MDGYASLPVGANGGYPNQDYVPADYVGEYPAELTGSAQTFKRERIVNEGTPPQPLFPGQTVHGFYPRFGNINRQLETDPEYTAAANGIQQSVTHDTTEGINAKHVDSWNMHPGDVNLQTGYWEAGDGTPRQNDDLVAAGPVRGFNVQWSGFVAQGRIPTAGQPGPVTGRTGADYLQSVQAANAEVAYATQVSDAALNNAVFGS